MIISKAIFVYNYVAEETTRMWQKENYKIEIRIFKLISKLCTLELR